MVDGLGQDVAALAAESYVYFDQNGIHRIVNML
jgi:hypothetical protein